jgi:hypothetical protein
MRVTGDETWISFVDVETEEQSKWMHRHSSNKLKKFKQTSARKLMAVVSLDADGGIHAARGHSVRTVL